MSQLLTDRVTFREAGNALTFTDYDSFTHPSCTDPFPPPVVRHVMDEVVASLRRRKRAFTVLYRYYGPCPISVDPLVFRTQFMIPMRFGHPVSVFVSAPTLL